MDAAERKPQWIAEQLELQCGVLVMSAAVRWIGRSAVRWRLASGRWQQPCRRVVVTHTGPLTTGQWLWAAVLACGTDAVLGGLTAARLDGLTGFDERRIHVLIPAARRVRPPLPGVVVHRALGLGPADVHPVRTPPRTRIARSLLDAAAWAGTGDRARGILAAGVQQRIVRTEQLAEALARQPRLHRHNLMMHTLNDVAGGAEALSELDFCRLARRYGLPEPERQVFRMDSAGRRRWLDCYWECARLVVEVDGKWHMEALAWWADMRRDNELTVNGYRVLRFPAYVVRDHPATVAGQIAVALSGVPA